MNKFFAIFAAILLFAGIGIAQPQGNHGTGVWTTIATPTGQPNNNLLTVTGNPNDLWYSSLMAPQVRLYKQVYSTGIKTMTTLTVHKDFSYSNGGDGVEVTLDMSRIPTSSTEISYWVEVDILWNDTSYPTVYNWQTFTSGLL